jgi:hypothetical protein
MYNMAPITREGGTGGVTTLSIDGLTVKMQGQVYEESDQSWQPIGLFELKLKGFTLVFTAKNVDLNGLSMGILNTPASITIDGAAK